MHAAIGIIWKVCYDKIISKLSDVTRLEHFEISKPVWFLMSLFPFNFTFFFKVDRAETPPTVERVSGDICFSPVFTEHTILATSAAPWPLQSSVETLATILHLLFTRQVLNVFD